MHTNSRDEALALPAEETARLALRTQQIIAHESSVGDSVDPLGGSFLVEHLTNEIEKKTNEYLAKIESMGGSIKAIEQQYYQSEIADSAYTYQLAIEQKEKIIVGVNDFTIQEDTKPPILRIDANIRNTQVQRLMQLKKQRDNALASRSLESLKQAAKGNENLIPFILTAVQSYATLGEISDALRDVWGEY